MCYNDYNEINKGTVIHMNFVEPIKSLAHITSMKSFLKQHSLRDSLLFTLGINSALRISDLLRLTIEDVDGMDRINVTEAKTGKTKSMPWNPNCISAINEYLDSIEVRGGLLFPSRKGGSTITRQHAYKVINDAAKYAGVVTEKNGVLIGSHSLRKTFAYHAYNNGTSIEVIQKILNHSSSATSLAYIWITKQTVDDVYISLNL